MMELFGLRVPVAPLRDLIWMKLNSFRVKDQVHLQTLDEAGLITGDLEHGLPVEMRERLARAREQFAAEQPDQE